MIYIIRRFSVFFCFFVFSCRQMAIYAKWQFTVRLRRRTRQGARHHGQHTCIPLLRHNTARVKKGIVITWCIVEPPDSHCKTPCSENHSAHCCLSSGLSSWGEYCDKPFGSKYEPLGNSSSIIPRTITAPPCSTVIAPGR